MRNIFPIFLIFILITTLLSTLTPSQGRLMNVDLSQISVLSQLQTSFISHKDALNNATGHYLSRFTKFKTLNLTVFL